MKIFSGVLELNADDPLTFVNSMESRSACRQALADVLHLDLDEVAITGISPGGGGRRLSTPIVGYQVKVPSESGLTIAKIVATSSAVKVALNVALKASGVKVEVTEVLMPDPAAVTTNEATDQAPEGEDKKQKEEDEEEEAKKKAAEEKREKEEEKAKAEEAAKRTYTAD